MFKQYIWRFFHIGTYRGTFEIPIVAFEIVFQLISVALPIVPRYLLPSKTRRSVTTRITERRLCSKANISELLEVQRESVKMLSNDNIGILSAPPISKAMKSSYFPATHQ